MVLVCTQTFITLGTVQALDTLVLAHVCSIGTHNNMFLMIRGIMNCGLNQSVYNTGFRSQLIMNPEAWYSTDYTFRTCSMNWGELKTCDFRWKALREDITRRPININTFAASYLNTQGLNNSCLKSPASTLVDLTFQSRALRSFSLNQLCNLSL